MTARAHQVGGHLSPEHSKCYESVKFLKELPQRDGSLKYLQEPSQWGGSIEYLEELPQ